jgi:hypothetical protein
MSCVLLDVRGKVFETGKKFIVDVLDRAGYRLVSKEHEVITKEALDERIETAVKEILREKYSIVHLMPLGYPPVKYAFVDEMEPTKEDEAVARRLLAFYNKSVNEESASTDYRDLWTSLREGPHADFISLLGENNAERLAAYLCNVSRHTATAGVCQDSILYDDLASSDERRNYYATFILDKLVCLAEALRSLPHENPESGRWGINIYTDVEELINGIEKALGTDITRPRVLGGLFGLATSRGVLDFRYVCGIYTAWRMRQILKDREDPAVCEIGGGIGCVAHMSNKLGLKNYTIFDLPHVGVLSGYYLIKSLPQGAVTLYGEENNQESPSIRIFPYWHFDRTDQTKFDLTLNQDSLPEIDSSVVNWYLDSIPKNTRGFFLSINQEGQTYLEGLNKEEVFVSGLLENRTGYELVYRFPCWIRAGYTEELYRITR